MDQVEIAKALTAVLERRSLTFAEDARLVEDLDLDSYELVSIILEMEELMDLSFDDDTQVLFSEGKISEIINHLKSLK